MQRYIVSRIVTLFTSLILASLIVFTMIEAIPGDVASFMLGLNATPEAIENLRSELGINQNLPLRYLSWLSGLLTGDFGISYTYKVPVKDLILARMTVSIPLSIYSILLTIGISFPAGIIAATYHRKPTDYGIMGLSQFGISIPNFWFAMILVLLFSINLGWFPAGGFLGWQKGFFYGLLSLTLPALALALPQAAILIRIIRASLIETLKADYIRTARAKGLTHHQAILRHGLKNAMIPILTILGLQFSFLLAGAIIIENVFFLPGLGRLIFQGIIQRDLIVVESVVILLVFTIILINFIIDITYLVIDPRLREKK